MTRTKSLWNFIRDLFGFRKNSKYIKSYLNDANIKSSIYMSFIVIILEIWMIIRNLNKYVVPSWDSGTTSNFDLLFAYTGLYILFIVCSAAVLVFAITYLKNEYTKSNFILNIVVACICLLWPFLLFLENLSFDGSKQIISSTTVIIVYVAMALLGSVILANALYKRKYDNNNMILSAAVITCFALVCLAFGIKVGYSDFANPYINVKTGLPNYDRLKMITCFLTMIIFVACLLIWKPYISIVMLTGIFVGFMYMLKGYGDREFLEADEINYITFLISLTMITISIYQQRITEAKKDEKLIHDAIYDHLADIYNVKHLADIVKMNEMVNPDSNRRKIFLFINIFNFRAINDQKGFEAGDRFIIRISKIIKEIFNDDLTARQSDDHFVVFTSVNGYLDKLEKLNKRVIELADGLFVRIKAGGYIPKSGDSPYTSIDKARYACGIIKRKSELLFMEYDEELNERVNKRQYIVNHLDEAIEKEWIKAYYQPVVWSDSKELCGAEALARWIDPKYGFLSPADFIPVLEETRLIYKLDAYIIEYVCKYMRKALDDNKPIVPVSINFSRLDFELMDVIKTLDDCAKKYNINKDYLHVEITESSLSDNVDSLNKTISSLRSEGYAIWLDDFGSGYSSLNVLKDFTFDVVKIDMKFLSNFDTNEKTKDVIDCIIQLANRLGMKTLTEGVETQQEADFLEEIGCGRLQGYLFGKPVPLADFEDKIAKGELKITENILKIGL
ncbi:MAG: EAL domain-containing protein [Acholeplasmatales bacterium]|nr:EAL domain-containing protein [Acholeplasmatales bacterium]